MRPRVGGSDCDALMLPRLTLSERCAVKLAARQRRVAAVVVIQASWRGHYQRKLIASVATALGVSVRDRKQLYRAVSFGP